MSSESESTHIDSITRLLNQLASFQSLELFTFAKPIFCVDTHTLYHASAVILWSNRDQRRST